LPVKAEPPHGGGFPNLEAAISLWKSGNIHFDYHYTWSFSSNVRKILDITGFGA
jgi:hypothetical protein